MFACSVVHCLPACVFFPFRVVFVYLCFILLLKRLIPAFNSSPHLSSRTLTECTSALFVFNAMNEAEFQDAVDSTFILFLMISAVSDKFIKSLLLNCEGIFSLGE